MVNITPEEKEKIIQLFETQEVDNLLLVYSLLEGFGLNILDCDWLIKDFCIKSIRSTTTRINLPISIEVRKDLNPINREVFAFGFVCYNSTTWDYCYRLSISTRSHLMHFKNYDYLTFRISKHDTDDNVYLDFISKVRNLQNYQSISL